MGSLATPEKLFWLDDEPWFLSGLAFAAPPGKALDLEDFLQRTTFALDFEEGERMVTGQEFDLYILDGDFPGRLADHRRSWMEQYLDVSRRGECLRLPYELARRDDTVIGCNFKSFYERCLRERGRRVIVFSVSDNALRQSAELGLPFYSKVLKTPADVLRSLASDPRRNFDMPDAWEHGTGIELVERYLTR